MTPEIYDMPAAVCGSVGRVTRWLARFSLALLLGGATLATAQQASTPADYPLGPGDVVRITVFQIPDLTTETRVSEQGYISFPLIGNLPVKGVPALALGRAIEQKLRDGGFVKQPQVTVVITQFKSIQVSVLGEVSKPGKYSLEQTKNRLSEVLAMAGGLTPLGDDRVTVSTQANGSEKRLQVDLRDVLQNGDVAKDVALRNGDVVYVPRYPVYYIYGEVNKPGQYRVERDMTVQQALAVGGGPTPRGTQRGMKLTRKDSSGKPVTREADPNELIHAGDVLFIQESIF